jgi:hypothetical protein
MLEFLSGAQNEVESRKVTLAFSSDFHSLAARGESTHLVREFES